MSQGLVVSIHIAPAARSATVSVTEVRAVPRRGLEGDRYFHGVGTFSRPTPDHEVTLIEIEALEALKRDYGIELEPGESRRNIVTSGVALNHLVGRDFKVGKATLRGLRLCEPCSHLEGLTQAGIIRGLIHRGGLRAQIVAEGVICIADQVAPSNGDPNRKSS